MPLHKLGALINRVCPIKFGLGIRAHIIYIVGRVEEVGVLPLFACQVE
jgi:hypothetical protein